MMQTQSPTLRLDFYPSTIMLSRWKSDGRSVTHPVAAQDVAAACHNIDLASGFLPPNTLFWRRQAGADKLGIYVPARRWCVHSNDDTITIPLPPFVFVGYKRTYTVYAVKRSPRSTDEPLYHAPCPNVHDSGAICQGDAPFPICTTQTMQAALTLFMEGSGFNHDLSRNKCRTYPDNINLLWSHLANKQRFPHKELVPCRMTLQQLL